MMFIALITPVIAIGEIGGWRETVAEVGRSTGRTMTSSPADRAWHRFAHGLGLATRQPHILARFMALRSSNDVPAARLIIWRGWCLHFMAPSSSVTRHRLLRRAAAGEQRDRVHPVLPGFVQSWAAGFCWSLSWPRMSTIDSQLLVCSSA
ncbi:MAG: hypothetical protein H6905_08765 [Hyphomicrobiales bacterium]|nr:hypothetical protein [Hyphomicrobiales bacterium]